MINKEEKEITKDWQGTFEKPLVSVYVITYNHEKYISEAIDSFLMQKTNFPFEIVIGEDCSTDNTRKILEEYKKKYPNIIKLIVSENNVGMHENGKRTIKECKGKYLAICEGDDYWIDKDKLQLQINEMRKYPNIDLSFHLASTINNLGQEIKPKLEKKDKLYSLKEIITADFHLVQTNTIIIKKEKMDKLNFDLISKSPAGDIWLKISGAIPNGVLFINRIMSTYRVCSESSWSSSLHEEKKFIKFVEDMMKSIESFDKYWGFKYTKSFFIYKNMYIDVVMRRNINQNLKNDFINKYRDLMSINNIVKWNMLYKYPKFVDFLKLLKNTIKGIFYVKTNNK
ncbi:glycosyltransferase [Aliarcobacter butzleri]|uniref:glycosyltransferase n=1 Tax=Aliarcobacter butzleri TaxID=28197 RepID=UPI001EDAB315|nr:glycosyltransferase [Aliarcobacter butzleri]MCG3710616.1 glycosyltransferase [Aliarcobacter butzleri]MCG3714123.1 glycosyltransferase [Aliarcobacter butzleri]